MEPKFKFSLDELWDPGPCMHSFKKPDCASCVYHVIWYQGRIDGLKEAASLLATNSAMVDAMRESVIEAELKNPGFYNNKLSNGI